jgi:hypothetical protein
MFALAVALLGFAARSYADLSYRTVALSRTHAPGAPPGSDFHSFVSAMLDASDRVGLWAIASLNGYGLWSETNGSLQPLIVTGLQVPGKPPGFNFDGTGTPAMNASGRMAFFSSVFDTSTNTGVTGLWSDRTGVVAPIVQQGEQAPGAPAGVTFDGIVRPAMNASGRVAFAYALKLDSGLGVTNLNDDGIWSDGSGSLALVARAGNQAPGTPPGSLFFLMGNPLINSAGRTAFLGILQRTGGVTALNESGIWSEGAGPLALVARQGNQSPGTPAGANLGNLTNPVLNGAGHVVFSGRMQGSVNSTNDSAIWSDRTGTLSLVAREGSQAPGAPAGANFGDLYLIYPMLNRADRIAFTAELQTTGGGVTAANNSGIWSDGAGAFKLVAREGNQPPGTPAGTRFDAFDPPTLNGLGRVAFQATLKTGSGVTTANDVGLWAEDKLGILTLVAREGSQFEVAPGDLRTIAELNFETGLGVEAGRQMTFNDNFTIAFRATFTDQTSGVFTATLTNVPEPTAPILVASALAGAMRAARGPRRRLRHPVA